MALATTVSALLCIEIGAASGHLNLACEAMRDALKSEFNISDIELVYSQDEAKRFQGDSVLTYVFKEIPPTKIRGNLIGGQANIPADYADWLATSSIIDTNDIALAYPTLAQGLIKLSKENGTL